MLNLNRFMPAAALIVALLAPVAVHAADDTQAIRHVMMKTWDKPESRLQVEPIVLRGAHAVAGWTQGERGGRALMARNGDGSWRVVLCAGDGIRNAPALQDAGLSAADAQALARDLAAAEAKLPAAHRSKFATFDGIVRMDAHGQHPPASDAAHGQHTAH
jgi:hypothetical protein